MIKVTVQKNLIGLEDLLIGVGTVAQARGPTGTTPVTITKINGANFPYDENFTMAEKFDALQLQLDMLPDVIDEDGHMLAGYILSSTLDLDLTSPVKRIWNKEISSSSAELYYGDTLLFEYDPTDGNIIIPGGTDYVAADAVVTAAFEAADADLQADIDALFDATEAIHDLDVGTSANNLVQLDGTGKLPAVDGSALTNIPTASGVPIGTIIAVPYSTPDDGWMKCNGNAISRTTYSALFAKIGTTHGTGDGSTTFNLPEIRGEFLRFWDDSRGIDSGRALGSAQTDEIKAHTHAAGTLAAGSSGAHTHSQTATEPNGTGANFAFSGNLDNSQTVVTASSGAHTHTITGSTASTGSSETRPRNVALMALIKVL